MLCLETARKETSDNNNNNNNALFALITKGHIYIATDKKTTVTHGDGMYGCFGVDVDNT